MALSALSKSPRLRLAPCSPRELESLRWRSRSKARDALESSRPRSPVLFQRSAAREHGPQMLPTVTSRRPRNSGRRSSWASCRDFERGYRSFAARPLLCWIIVAVPLVARDACDRWTRQLASWAIPESVLLAAPESPWGFPPDLFALSTDRALADPESNPSKQRAIEAIPPGGSVLDIGAGGGGASLPLVPPAALLIAVDESQAMLDVFAERAERYGVRHSEIVGRWPDATPKAPGADVVVCHHVLYNVGDLAPFLVALSGHAERRVVIELTDRHPQSDLSPLWKVFHGIDRPTGPTAADAADVAGALGYDTHLDRFERPSLWHDWPRAERVAFARRRLCVGPEHDAEISSYLDDAERVPREVVTLWWDRSS